MRLLIILLLVASPLRAWSQWDQNTLQMQTPELSPNNVKDPTGWWPFISLNMGVFDYDGGRDTGDGRNLQAKGLLSYYSLGRKFIFEGGVGFQNSDMLGRSTNSGLLEASTRFRFLEAWEAGPSVQTFVGSGDRYGSSNDDLTTFVGAQILYRIPLDNGHLVRAGGRVATDIGIPGELSNLVMFEVHYGFGDVGGNAIADRTPAAHPRTEHLHRQAYRVDWNGPRLAYSTRQVEPNSTDRKGLAQLAKALLNDEIVVEKIRIVGHADERGSAYSNNRLSLARAQSAANALIFAGYPKEKIEIIAMGQDLPLAPGLSPESLALNRRVEIQFFGVSNMNQLKQIVEVAGLK